MKGSMREAQDGFAELKDVDEQTFVRFCQYAYIGDYTIAQYEVILDSPVTARQNASLQGHECDATVPTDEILNSKKKDKKKKGVMSDFSFETSCVSCGHTPDLVTASSGKQALLNDFQRRYYPVSISTFQPHRNSGEDEDYTNIFLCHSRIYVFAEKYDIASLRTLALYKLHQMLKAFKLHGKWIGDIVSLIKYSYNNDNTRDNEVGQEVDSLRKLVVHYVACVFEIVARDHSFLALMEEGGPFVRDLMSMLLKRMD
jgi:hypothetical protein